MMKEYGVFLQNNYYKNMVKDSITEVFKQIYFDITNNLVPNFDHSIPAMVKIIPIV